MTTTPSHPALLLIDSDPKLRALLEDNLSDSAGRIVCASTLQEGVGKNREDGYDVVLLRDRLSDGLASEIIPDLQAGLDSPEIIIFTIDGDPLEAEKALKAGVWEYIIDSSPADILPKIVRRALRYRKNKVEDLEKRLQGVRAELRSSGIIGSSKIMQNCIDLTVRIAESDANVLIAGESGTGKELFAATIHNLSSRSENNFAIVDCAALPPSLAESILFGHAKGSFTGADKQQPGLIPQSDRGTLFLDEIGELPIDIQKKFLRIVQERTYLPVGATTERKINFRLIAATNKDLHAMTEAGEFREDLLFRLKTFHLELPALRTRVADIAELAYYCRDKFCKREKLKKKKFSPDFLLVLTQYEWPGNVRELFQAIERSIVDARESTVLYPIHLPPGIRVQVAQKKLQQSKAADRHVPDDFSAEESGQAVPTLKQAREQAIAYQEERYLQKVLALTGGDIKQCCQIADLSRSRLYDLLKKYNLPARQSSS